MITLIRLFRVVLWACALLLPLRRAWPGPHIDRPVTIIIPFGPGGAVDIAARILAEYFQTKHNITLNIVCKGGGAGAPAMLDVAKTRPDGYTYGFRPEHLFHNPTGQKPATASGLSGCRPRSPICG